LTGVPYTEPVWIRRRGGRKKDWTWKKIVRMVKELHAMGEPLNWWHVRHRGDKYERMAFGASQKCSCGWSVALQKAGFDPKEIRKKQRKRIIQSRGKRKNRTVRAHVEDDLLKLQRRRNAKVIKRLEQRTAKYLEEGLDQVG
jgi:hypothetical protein